MKECEGCVDIAAAITLFAACWAVATMTAGEILPPRRSKKPFALEILGRPSESTHAERERTTVYNLKQQHKDGPSRLFLAAHRSERNEQAAITIYARPWRQSLTFTTTTKRLRRHMDIRMLPSDYSYRVIEFALQPGRPLPCAPRTFGRQHHAIWRASKSHSAASVNATVEVREGPGA